METISSYVLTFLLNSIWQIPLFMAVAMLAAWFMQDAPSSHRHAVWVTALIASIVVPVFSGAPARRQVEAMPVVLSYEARDVAPARAALPKELQSDASPAPHRTMSFPATAASVLAGAYLLLVLYFVTRLMHAWNRTRKLRSSAALVHPSPQLQRACELCLRTFRMEGVELRASDDLSCPAMAGALRPYVILPSAMLTETSEEVLTSGIAHELAHVVRRDYVLNLVYEVLLIPIHFHPAARWIARAIQQTRELACDELVTRRVMKADVYAKSILEIASGTLGRVQPGYMLGVFDADILEHRIRRLITQRAGAGKRGAVLLATGLAGMCVCAVLVSGSSIVARAQTRSYSELKLGEEAFNRRDLAVSIHHFEAAVALDPTNIKNRLFLANAQMAKWFTERSQPFSPHMVAAQQNYDQVLAYDPGNRDALHGLVGIALNSRRPSDALALARRLIESDGSDTAAHFSEGVANWAIVYEGYSAANGNAEGAPHASFLSDAGVRGELRAKYGRNIEEGLASLNRAVELKTNFDEAMAYKNLLLRLKAGISATEAESRQWMEEADVWLKKALAVSKGAGRGSAVQMALNVDGPPPSLAETRKMIPPVPGPPPPPPPPPGYRGERP